MRSEILLFEGFDELDAIAPFEVLHAAGWPVKLVTLGGAAEVVSARGVPVRTDGRRLGAGNPEVVVVPGGGWATRAERGAWAEAERGEIPAALAELHRAGTLLAAVCTGGMLLAAGGLLKDRPAVTHHAALEELAACGAAVVRARVSCETRTGSQAGRAISGLLDTEPFVPGSGAQCQAV